MTEEQATQLLLLFGKYPGLHVVQPIILLLLLVKAVKQRALKALIVIHYPLIKA